MKLRIVDVVALRKSRNIQGGMRCFSLVTSNALQYDWKDASAHKFIMNDIGYVNCMTKNQKSEKWLKCDDS